MVPGSTFREQGIKTRKGKKPIKGPLLSMLLHWATGFQFYRGTLGDSVEFSSELSQFRSEEVGYLSSISHLSLHEG